MLHNQLAACLRRRGLSSVQFTGQALHPQDDRWCGRPVLEIADLTSTGLGCLGDLELRSGWHGSGPRVTECWNGCAMPPQVCSELRLRALTGRVRPGARCNPQTLALSLQHSISPCIKNITFGCTDSREGVWVAAGCRAKFALGEGQFFDCGKLGMSNEKTRHCALPPVDAPVGPCRAPERAGNVTLREVLKWSRQEGSYKR